MKPLFSVGLNMDGGIRLELTGNKEVDRWLSKALFSVSSGFVFYPSPL